MKQFEDFEKVILYLYGAGSGDLSKHTQELVLAQLCDWTPERSSRAFAEAHLRGLLKTGAPQNDP